MATIDNFYARFQLFRALRAQGVSVAQWSRALQNPSARTVITNQSTAIATSALNDANTRAANIVSQIQGA